MSEDPGLHHLLLGSGSLAVNCRDRIQAEQSMVMEGLPSVFYVLRMTTQGVRLKRLNMAPPDKFVLVEQET